MGRPTVLCSPDKLRGAVTAREAARALAAGVRAAGAVPHVLPVADGGEGTLDALVGAGVAVPVPVTARDALGRRRPARLGRLGGDRWLVEAAEAVGLARLGPGERDPLRASSAGVGDLVRAALDRGARELVVALGGTATVDLGLGLLAVLGASVPGRRGKDLLEPPHVEWEGLDPRVRDARIEVLWDVDAPLCGPAGAAWRFGPQKGLRADDVAAIDEALARWAAQLGPGIAERPGAGAAGGLGAALYALGAGDVQGARRVLALEGFDDALEGATLCLTAEGAVDAQTLQGKAVMAVVEAAVDAEVPVVVCGGRVEDDAAGALRELGAAEVVALGPPDRPLAEALAAARDELEAAAREATLAHLATA